MHILPHVKIRWKIVKAGIVNSRRNNKTLTWSAPIGIIMTSIGTRGNASPDCFLTVGSFSDRKLEFNKGTLTSCRDNPVLTRTRKGELMGSQLNSSSQDGWRKSRKSTATGGSVEVKDLGTHISVRDSHDPFGPTLDFSHAQYGTLVKQVAGDAFDYDQLTQKFRPLGGCSEVAKIKGVVVWRKSAHNPPLIFDEHEWRCYQDGAQTGDDPVQLEQLVSV